MERVCRELVQRRHSGTVFKNKYFLKINDRNPAHKLSSDAIVLR